MNNEIRFKAIDEAGNRTLPGKYFWDGKRIWIWNDHNQRYYDHNSTGFKMHSRFRRRSPEPAPEIETIKRDWVVSAGLPLARHGAGDLVAANGRTILCTDDILPLDQCEPGEFPFITDILNGILGRQAPDFVRWLSKAYAFTREQSSERPEIPCVAGSCNSAKGLLSVVASMALCGHPSRGKFNLIIGQFRKPEAWDFSQMVFQIDLASDPGKVERLKKVLKVETGSKRFHDVELDPRRVIMIRCHEGHWRPWERTLPEIPGFRFIMFRAAQSFSVSDGEERMLAPKLIEKIESEIRKFRFHLMLNASLEVRSA